MALVPAGTDPALVEVAIDPARQGFSRLEFLGDAILGLAVYASGVAAGESRDELMHRVSNSQLRRVRAERLSAATTAPTGDVVEALVAAIHLSAGFDDAARWSVSMCLPGCEAVVGGDARSRAWLQEATGTARDPAVLAFVGAALIDAVLADHLCRSEPTQTQGWYSSRKNTLRARRRIARLARDGRPGKTMSDARAARLSDEVEAELATAFLEQGWSCAAEVLSRLGVDA